MKDLEILLDDLHPAVRGGWVVGFTESKTLGIGPQPIEGEIRDIYRELDGKCAGRVVLVVYDTRCGHDRLVLPENCKSRKPPRRDSIKAATAAIDAAEKKAAKAQRRTRRGR